MKKLFICLLALSVAAGTLTSCNEESVMVDYEDPNYGNEEEEPEKPQQAAISVTSDVFSISAVAGKLKNVVLITNQTEFTISPLDADWYSTEFVGKDLRITSKTSNTGTERKSVLVTVTAGSGTNTATASFTIQQNTIRDEPAEISVAQSTFTVGGKDGDVTRIPLVTNQEVFSISPDEPWYRSSFDGSTLVITTLESNSTGALRNHEVVVTAGEAPNTATVRFILSQALKPEVDPLIGSVINEGIVFWVNRDTGKYKAAALIDGNPTFTVFWQASGTTRVLTGASDRVDGRNNVPIYKAQTNYNDYIAVKYCDDKAPAQTWYLPAYNEVQTLYDNIEDYGRAAFNATVSANSGHTFDYEGKTYWTSTERSDVNAFCLRFSDNKWLDQSKTSAARHIRCITEGDIP